MTIAPAAASIGACCPPADAKHKTLVPRMSPSHALGTFLFGVNMTSQSPFLAALMVALSTG
jgi:hypothetical protein